MIRPGMNILLLFANISIYKNISAHLSVLVI